MLRPAIRVTGLGKKYHVGRKRSLTFRDAFGDTLKRLTLRGAAEATAKSEIWALRDVSFEIQEGEVVGVIGRNGAGKSTLLKILSRVTEPSAGRAELFGRVGSLLEVGTGFHPDLTGRENVSLSGAILGMSRSEVARKFDEIVCFAEVERFIDTQVKHYSSGMYMRLAFAVAAHLEPEILLVDEVLAVGDVAFQKKCLGRMEEISRSGRTVVFVSHNLGSVAQLCRSAIVLSQGCLTFSGSAEKAIQQYLSEGAAKGRSARTFDGPPRADVVLRRAWISSGSKLPDTAEVSAVELLAIHLEIEVLRERDGVNVSVRVFDARGYALLTSSIADANREPPRFEPGFHELVLTIAAPFFSPGRVSFDVIIHRPNIELFEWHASCLSVDVEETGSHMAPYAGSGYGVLMPLLPWQAQMLPRMSGSSSRQSQELPRDRENQRTRNV